MINGFSYGEDYVEMQWDGIRFVCKGFLLEIKMKNSIYKLSNYIQYIYIYIQGVSRL